MRYLFMLILDAMEQADGTYFKGCTDVPVYDPDFSIPSNENWDDRTYNSVSLVTRTGTIVRITQYP
jgi:hypothetical protein